MSVCVGGGGGGGETMIDELHVQYFQPLVYTCNCALPFIISKKEECSR